DLEKAYFTFYFPFIYKLPFPVKIPYFMLNIVRRSYRKYKKLKKKFKL
ncbi:serine/threonine protein kinase, partial [Bacillus thuringiensis]